SCFGLVGMKPTRGRNPLGPVMGDQMNGLVHDHVVTRSVRDSAAMLDATHGNVQGDPYWAPPAPDSFLAQVSIEPGKLKIGVTDTPPLGGEPEAEVSAGLRGTADKLSDLGHDVEPVSWPVSADMINEIFMTIWMGGCASGIDGVARLTGRQPDESLFEPLTWAFYQLGKMIDASTYLLAVGGMQSIAREIAAAHAGYDVVLTPTLGKRPLRLGDIDTTQTDIEAQSDKLLGFASYTPLQNMTGQPSISLPLHMSAESLPIGMMFTGRFGDEATLYRLAGQLEREMPWRDRKPGGFY
ncbi:MAG: amidase, partial [Pseudomonadales bacterium]|nr:amidase [Pseudomonadales bacterium]